MGSCQGLTASGVKREQIHVPSQTAIGEIKMARTVRTKDTASPVCGSPAGV